MKAIFLDLKTIFFDTHSPEKIRESIISLEYLIDNINNAWIVICNKSPLDLDQIRELFKTNKFKYSHRIFDQIKTTSKMRSSIIAKWLREYAEVNEVNAFGIISCEHIDGLLENYAIITETLDITRADQILKNFKQREYEIKRIWEVIDVKNRH